MRDLYDIKCDLEEMANMSCKPSTTKPKTGDIIDEDKSVKWNREEVVRLQNEYEKEVKELNTAKNKRREKLETVETKYDLAGSILAWLKITIISFIPIYHILMLIVIIFMGDKITKRSDEIVENALRNADNKENK